MIDYKYEQMLSHDISLSDAYVNTHFGFRVDDQALSKSAVDRIFDYAHRLTNDKESAVGNDLWGIIGKHHQELMETCIRRDYDKFWKITKILAQTSNVLGFMNQFPYPNLESIEQCRKVDAYHCIAYFSDRGRLFHRDRGRRFSAIVDAQGCAQARV